MKPEISVIEIAGNYRVECGDKAYHVIKDTPYQYTVVSGANEEAVLFYLARTHEHRMWYFPTPNRDETPTADLGQLVADTAALLGY